MSGPQQRIALMSVTDKTGIVAFAHSLVALNFKILSTGGTAKVLQEAGVPVEQVSDFAKSPEVFDGRVKTLHPKIHGGILFDRFNAGHVADAKALNFPAIDVIVVNLYQFGSEALAKQLPANDAIEYVDVGGPTMMRAAAKNYRSCLPVVDPLDYQRVATALEQGDIPEAFRLDLAIKTFQITAQYDSMIASYLSGFKSTPEEFPSRLPLGLDRELSLRYGENPHQSAAVYGVNGHSVMQQLQVLQGKELSYNNLVDLEAAQNLIEEFPDRTAVAIIKHTNPCGMAVARKATESLLDVYRRAHKADAKSAFGGIVAVNKPIDLATAEAMAEIFYECIMAPDVSPEALEVFAKKKNLRIVVKKASPRVRIGMVKSVFGGILMQSEDPVIESHEGWRSVTKKAVTEEHRSDLLTAMRIAKHVKSNAIVLVKEGVTLAVGAGQMSRIDAARFAILKAKEFGHSLAGAVVASDAFFPFRDCVDLLVAEGIAAFVQPGGSVNDQQSIDACDEKSVAMCFTGRRHFRH